MVRWRISPCAASLNTLCLRTDVRNGLWLAQCCSFGFHEIGKFCLTNLLTSYIKWRKTVMDIGLWNVVLKFDAWWCRWNEFLWVLLI
jgi:hypothetical protein